MYLELPLGSFVQCSYRAFVAPADIQAFTAEVKNKLSTKSQSKAHKYYAQATEEICEAFEELHHKDSSSLRDGIDKSDVDCEDLSAYGEEDVLHDGLIDGNSADYLSPVLPPSAEYLRRVHWSAILESHCSVYIQQDARVKCSELLPFFKLDKLKFFCTVVLYVV